MAEYLSSSNTVRANFGSIPCSDCGKSGKVHVKHSGPLVPKGKSGYFDDPCFENRIIDYEKGISPRPLGTSA